MPLFKSIRVFIDRLISTGLSRRYFSAFRIFKAASALTDISPLDGSFRFTFTFSNPAFILCLFKKSLNAGRG